jgi:hypothetical protein
VLTKRFIGDEAGKVTGVEIVRARFQKDPASGKQVGLVPRCTCCNIALQGLHAGTDLVR